MWGDIPYVIIQLAGLLRYRWGLMMGTREFKKRGYSKARRAGQAGMKILRGLLALGVKEKTLCASDETLDRLKSSAKEKK